MAEFALMRMAGVHANPLRSFGLLSLEDALTNNPNLFGDGRKGENSKAYEINKTNLGPGVCAGGHAISLACLRVDFL